MSESNRKDRVSWITVDTKFEEDQFAFSAGKDGSVHFTTEVTNGKISIAYPRPSKPKVLNETPFDGSATTWSADAALREYDRLVAVDTNTRTIRGARISVSGIVRGAWTNAARSEFEWSTPYCLMFDADANCERLGWALALACLDRDGLISREDRMALIVDSELRKLAAINARKEVVWGTLPLPPNVTALYATSDAGAEFGSNHLIRRADRVAALCLSEIEAGRIPIEIPRHPGRAFAGPRKLLPASAS